MEKTLDVKLRKLQEQPGCNEFILADAKDADMAFGLRAPGLEPPDAQGGRRLRNLQEFRQLMRDIVADGVVDIMLMSVGSCSELACREGLFADSGVTPAVRANDTTDIWLAGGEGGYGGAPSRPFRTACLEHAMQGRLGAPAGAEATGSDLGLYSITFNNDVELDLLALERYREFRLEAERRGFRHFLEVFAPNAPRNLSPGSVPGFVNDALVRALAGVPAGAGPRFLKIPYFGPGPLESLVAYDPTMVVGIMGGSAGTTHDTFRLLHDAQKYGARAALFGRRINNAEHQVTFIRYLRRIVDGEVAPDEAVRAYHGDLQGMGIRPVRPLADDLQVTTPSA